VFGCRVARWFVLKPKIPIWVNFGEALDWKMLIYLMDIWNILQTFGIFYRHLEYFMTLRTFCDHLVHFMLVLVSCRYLATLFGCAKIELGRLSSDPKNDFISATMGSFSGPSQPLPTFKILLQRCVRVHHLA
jgi:hypothetical protein